MKRLLLSHPDHSLLTAVVIVLVIIAMAGFFITAPEYSFVYNLPDGINKFDFRAVHEIKHARSGKLLAIYPSLFFIVAGLMLIACIWVWAITKNSLIWVQALARLFAILLASATLIIIALFLFLALMGRNGGIYGDANRLSDNYEQELRIVETRSCVGCSFSRKYRFVNKDLQGVDLTGANLSEMNLDGVNFSGANLTGAKMGRGTRLKGTDFTDADLTGVGFAGYAYRGAIYCNTTMPMENYDEELIGGNRDCP